MPNGWGWQFEPIWGGSRCLAFRDDERVDLTAKSGKPLGRFSSEVPEALVDVAARRFVVDGELAIARKGACACPPRPQEQ